MKFIRSLGMAYWKNFSVFMLLASASSLFGFRISRAAESYFS